MIDPAGFRIRRFTSRITQVKLQEQTGIHNTVISRWEHGHLRLSDGVVRRLLKALLTIERERLAEDRRPAA